MYLKKCMAVLLSVALALCLLTGCGGSTYSSKLSIVINDAQTILDLSHRGELDRALRKALADYQAGEDFNVIRDRVIEELGLEDVVYFSSSGVSNARDGQHAVQVFRIEGGTSDNAIDQLSAQIAEILKALTSGGQYDGAVSMIEKDGVFYAVVDLHVIQSGSGTSGGGGGKPAVTLASIAVTAVPDKTEYYVNQAFDKTGMQITATFSDGSIRDVTNECDISPARFTSNGKQQVTITYEDQTTTTTVTVFGLQSITVTDGPTTKEYTTGETFDTAGIVLTATYTDGSNTKKDVTGITTSIAASSEPFQTAGSSIPVTITYTNDYGQTAYTIVNVKVTQVGIESEDNYTIPANVISELEASLRYQVNQKVAGQGYMIDTQTDPAIQVKINKAMEAFAETNFDPPSYYKTYLRTYGIPVLDLINEFKDVSELNQVKKYYYAGGTTIGRRAAEAQDIWNSLPSRITSQLNTWDGDNILDKDDPYATNTYRYYINLSAHQYYSEKYGCDMLNVSMTIIVERIRTPRA